MESGKGQGASKCMYVKACAGKSELLNVSKHPQMSGERAFQCIYIQRVLCHIAISSCFPSMTVRKVKGRFFTLACQPPQR